MEKLSQKLMEALEENNVNELRKQYLERELKKREWDKDMYVYQGKSEELGVGSRFEADKVFTQIVIGNKKKAKYYLRKLKSYQKMKGLRQDVYNAAKIDAENLEKLIKNMK